MARKQDGKNCKVTWENRIEFTTLVEQYRLNEFKLQTDAIAKGIQCIIPSYYLGLFSWQQLESRVCGDPNFDIDLLKRKTIYVSVLPQDQHILIARDYIRTVKTLKNRIKCFIRVGCLI